MKVKIIKNDTLNISVHEVIPWYNIGEIYDVKPYRYNPDDYWEIEGWNGYFEGKSNLGVKFYIKKTHCKPYYEDNEMDNLFEL